MNWDVRLGEDGMVKEKLICLRYLCYGDFNEYICYVFMSI